MSKFCEPTPCNFFATFEGVRTGRVRKILLMEWFSMEIRDLSTDQLVQMALRYRGVLN
jgi:hypothetical protein